MQGAENRTVIEITLSPEFMNSYYFSFLINLESSVFWLGEDNNGVSSLKSLEIMIRNLSFEISRCLINLLSKSFCYIRRHIICFSFNFRVQIKKILISSYDHGKCPLGEARLG
jgi:hypothetical protein